MSLKTRTEILVDRARAETNIARIWAALRKHWIKRGHSRCHECDRDLYQEVGLTPMDPAMPPLTEHRLACDVWRARQYAVPLAGEPTALLREWLRWFASDTGATESGGQELARRTRLALGLTTGEDVGFD